MNENGLRYHYDNMKYTAQRVPSTIHIRDTGIYKYFKKYLFQECMSPLEFTLPKHWDKTYFLETLYTKGYICVVKTDKFGVIPQDCGLYGNNIFYRPTHAIISNPNLKGIMNPKIGVQCELIKLTPDMGGITDIIDFYADRFCLIFESFDMNIVNTKLSYLILAKNKASAESAKVALDDAYSGNPVVVADKKLADVNGELNINPIFRDIKNLYIGNDLLELFKNLKNEFRTEIGIPNVNKDKKERMIKDEVNGNNVETMSKVSLWKSNIDESMEKVREMFGLSESELKVDWRFKDEDKDDLMGINQA